VKVTKSISRAAVKQPRESHKKLRLDEYVNAAQQLQAYAVKYQSRHKKPKNSYYFVKIWFGDCVGPHIADMQTVRTRTYVEYTGMTDVCVV